MTNDNLCECDVGLLSSDDIRTGYISGVTFRNKPVQYSAVDGIAIVEGCIAIGTVEEMEKNAERVRAGESIGEEDTGIAFGVGITGQQYRWPNALMPYVIDPNLPNKSRVTDAIAHWKQKTQLRFVQRTASNAGQHPNYVYFTRLDGCWSYVGMRSTGKQIISLADGCGTGSTIHEIGHAWGLWHEQGREDRGQFITVNWQNITAGRESNFNQHISDGDDYGAYDYGSIMHYGRLAFSKNNLPTIVPKQGGVTIGQRAGLSQGDINAVHAMYQVWRSNVTVTRTFSSPHSQNAHALMAGIGWRKVSKISPDGVTNMFAGLCEAVANSKKVNVRIDGQFIYEMYLN